MVKKRVFSGIKPSGDLTLGNYLGTIVNWVRNQDEKENAFCIVNEHAITVPQEPKLLEERTLELAKVFLAAGVNPEKSAIFVQSDRPEHTELAWILNCFAYFGEMNRMTQFKDKYKVKGENVSVGLFDYPVLMAADILLYKTDEVPVGEDQKQHVEITRDLAERFNKRYGEKIFTMPTPIISKEGARIMSLSNPREKMSKSDDNSSSYIALRDSDEEIIKKFSRAVTDSQSEIKFDQKNQPGISNLLNIVSVIKEIPIPALEKRYQGSNYGAFKKEVAQEVSAFLKPFKKNLVELDNNQEKVLKILNDGAKKMAPAAQETLSRVKKTIGLGL